MRQKHPAKPLPQATWLILFDGVCGWCTGWVRFLMTHDRNKRLRFTPLQSPLGQQLLAKFDMPRKEISTFVVITPDACLTKSTAALKLACHLGGPWRLAYIFIMVPKSLRDCVYDLIARYRYQLGETLSTCYRPPPEYLDRFLYDI